MSGLAGAFDPAGRPIDRDLFARVVSYEAFRGPDGVSSWHGPGAAMAFARFARTPDALHDRQPLHDAVPDLCVTFDGRLDNREELASPLGVRLSDETCDVALVSAAYTRWGTDCAVRLLGDFSLAVVDGRERRLFLARDIMGLRPLFYRVLNGVWWWASDQRALVSLDRPAINEGYVAERLTGRIASVDETIYHGIHRLPMAHALNVSHARVERWRYWRPDSGARLGYRDVRDYEQQFRTLLKEAVRARLRVHGRTALLLSGGIDSSSIAAQIAELRREGHAAALDVKTLSMTIPGSPFCEGRVIRQVLERLHLPSIMLPGQEPSKDDLASDAAASLDLPQPPGSSMIQPLRAAAVASGRFVVLTGYGGDDWFEPSYGELSDLMRSGRVVASMHWLRRMARVPDHLPLAQAVRQGTWMALPNGARHRVRHLLRRDPVPWWIDVRFARALDLADRLRRRPDDVDFESCAQYDIFRGATDGEATFYNDHEERYAAACGLEQRHPLMDRRIVEFALALPAELRCNKGLPKAVMRQAMFHVLPPAVTEIPANADFGFLGLGVLARLGGASRLVRLEPVRRGWMRAEAIGELYRLLEGGGTRYLWPLCAATGVDFWLIALEGSARAATEAPWTASAPHRGLKITHAR